MPDKEPLTRGRVLRAALDLLSAEGAGALSMRRVASALGVQAMSLYAHVTDKDDLLDGLVDLAFADIRMPPPGPWRERLRALAGEYRRWGLARPAVVGLLGARPLPAGGQLALFDLTLGLLAEAGLAPPDAIAGFHAIGAYVYGAVLAELQQTSGGRAAYLGRLITEVERLGPAHFPHAYPVRAALLSRDTEADFYRGFDALIDGLLRPTGGPLERRGAPG